MEKPIHSTRSSPSSSPSPSPSSSSSSLSPSSSLTASSSYVLWIVFLGLVIDLLAFASILPLFPRIIEHYIKEQGERGILGSLLSLASLVGNPDKTHDVILVGGLLGCLFSLLQFLSSFLIGSASDSYGRRPVLLLCMMGTSLSYLLWFFADDFLLFLLSRAFGGISKGIVQISTSIVTDVTQTRSRTKGMALIGVAFSIGFTIGPALGAYLATTTTTQSLPQLPQLLLLPYNLAHLHPHMFSAPAFFSLALSLFDLVFLALMLPETIHKKGASSVSGVNAERGEDVVVDEGQRRSILNQLHLLHFFYLFLFAGIEFTLTFMTVERFGFSNMENGRLLGFVGILSSVIQGGYLRRMGVRTGEHRVTMYGVVSLFLSSIVLALANQKWSLYVGVTLFTFASAVVVSCLTSMTSIYALSSNKGTELGRLRSYGQLGRAIGPLFVSSLYWWQGSKTAYSVTALAIFLPLYLTRKLAKEVGSRTSGETQKKIE